MIKLDLISQPEENIISLEETISLKSWEENEIVKSILPFEYLNQQNFIFNDEKNGRIKDEDDLIDENKINSINLKIFMNKGLEEPGNTLVNNQSPNSNKNKYDKCKPSKINQNNIEDNTKENSNQKDKENKDYEGENKNEKNTLNENPKIISKGRAKIGKNFLKKENKKKIIFNIIISNNKTEKDLFKIFYLFNPLISLEDNKCEKEESPKHSYEISKREMIRNAINKIKQGIKKNKKEIILSFFNQIININLKKKNSKNGKNKSQRKFEHDNIKKKIKARFLKAIYICLNKILKWANSKELFDLLPQCFVKDISKKGNGKSVLNMTLKELMTTDFPKEYEKKKYNMLKKKRDRDKKEEKNISNRKKGQNPDIKKYQKNKELIAHLENNKEFSNKINYEKMIKRTFTDLFKEYLESNEFEEDVLELLKEDDVSPYYISDYIINAFKYIEYFSKSN